MKKILFGAAMLAALSSCVNDEIVEVNQGEIIAFRASVDKALSRSMEPNVISLSNFNQFKVTAFTPGISTNYFQNLAVNKQVDGAWTTAASFYWPQTDLSFYAYAPTNLSSFPINGELTISDTSQKIVGYTPGKDCDTQPDLLVAYAKGNAADNQNTGVNLNFKHALSQIAVSAKCSNPYVKINVKSLRFVNVKTKADFTFPSQPTTAESTLEGCWNNYGTTVTTGVDSHVKSLPVETLLTDEFQSFFSNKFFMLIPQQLTAWNRDTNLQGAYLSFLCEIHSVDESGKTGYMLYPKSDETSAGKYAYVAIPIDTKWEAGKKYIYNINFCSKTGGGAGLIDPNPETGEDIHPNPKPGSIPGDPVLNQLIRFNVSLEEWKDATVINIDL